MTRSAMLFGMFKDQKYYWRRVKSFTENTNQNYGLNVEQSNGNGTFQKFWMKRQFNASLENSFAESINKDFQIKHEKNIYGPCLE